MNNLVPVQRRDKNNRLVTRWVKPEQAGASKAKGIPSPATKSESLQQKKTRLLDSMNFESEPSKGLLNVLEAQISFMSPQLLNAAFEQLDRFPESRRVNVAVRHSINRWAKNDRDDDKLMHALQFVGVETVWEKYLKPSPLGDGRTCSDIQEGVTSSFNLMKGRDGFGRGLEDEDVDRAVLAAYAATALDMHMVNRTPSGRGDGYLSWEIHQKHGDLVGVFEEFPDRLEEMIDYVHENGGNAGALRQHLRGDHEALSSGAL